jgi:hypothetical protein
MQKQDATEMAAPCSFGPLVRVAGHNDNGNAVRLFPIV